MKLRLKGSLKAGPNGKISLLTSLLDALAFWSDPLRVIHFIWFNIRCYGYFWGLIWSMWLIFIMIISLPYYLIALCLGARAPVMGQLATVYDQAGKARIVASTNSWIQCSLFGLHNKIFSILRSIPQDGTFDQNKPFDLLLESLQPGYMLYGFDLSAATDRLPIAFQKDILNHLGYPGGPWRRLLGIKYNSPCGFISYAVGQPMGAYSSFAMLALTHHVLVQVAAQKAGFSDRFTDYCILGDDIVIANSLVAEAYKSLIFDLGLEISESKSVISGTFTEFAKKLRGPLMDISPIGAGLILYSLRNKYYICVLVFEILERGLCMWYDVYPQLLSLLPKIYRRYFKLCDWFIALHLRRREHLGDQDHEILNPRIAYFNVFLNKEKIISLLEIMWNSTVRDWFRLWNSIKYTLNKGLFISQARVGLPDWSELIFFPLLPSTYIMIMSYATSLNDISKAFGNWWLLNSLEKDQINIFDVIAMMERESILDLDINDKKKVKLSLDNL
nr:RNA-dependent RNA polymerase [Cryphonectria cubensis mitovirus 2c]